MNAMHKLRRIAVVLAGTLLLILALPVALRAEDRVPTGPMLREQSGQVSILQLNVARRMRERLASDPVFIEYMTRFHSSTPSRFAGLEAGRQMALVDEFLNSRRGRPWELNADGTMTHEHWLRRESTAIHLLTTRAGFLQQVADAAGTTVTDLLA